MLRRASGPTPIDQASTSSSLSEIERPVQSCLADLEAPLFLAAQFEVPCICFTGSGDSCTASHQNHRDPFDRKITAGSLRCGARGNHHLTGRAIEAGKTHEGGAADDYMIKPFSPRLFVAHVHALLRRAEQVRGQRWQDQNISIGEISLNLQQMHALVNGDRVPLTPRELSLLHALMENANRVLSRDQLMRIAWGDRFVGTPKAVDVYVQRLRRKIQPHLTAGFYIQASRGFGYKFEMPRPQPVAS